MWRSTTRIDNLLATEYYVMAGPITAFPNNTVNSNGEVELANGDDPASAPASADVGGRRRTRVYDPPVLYAV